MDAFNQNQGPQEPLDPYHRWLGIPPKDQPANHYRLLGIELFESDPEVVRDAAERQMAHVRRYALGKHADLSQQILNELAAAKACLIDPGRKAAYDKDLRERQIPSQPASQEIARPSVTNPLASPEEIPLFKPVPRVPLQVLKASAPIPQTPTPVPQTSGSQPRPWMVWGGFAAAVVLVGGLAISLFSGRRDVPSARPQAANNLRRPVAAPATVPTPVRSPAGVVAAMPAGTGQADATDRSATATTASPPGNQPVTQDRSGPNPNGQTVAVEEPLSWPLLTQFLNDGSHWHVEKGQWQSKQGRIVGSGDCIRTFNHRLPGDFALEVTVDVISGMRPRIYLPGFCAGNEGYTKAISLFNVDGATGTDFPYTNGQTMRLRIVAGPTVQLYVNGVLVKEGHRRAADRGELRISGGDYWSRGVTAFSEFRAGPRIDEAQTVATAKPEDVKPPAQSEEVKLPVQAQEPKQPKDAVAIPGLGSFNPATFNPLPYASAIDKAKSLTQVWRKEDEKARLGIVMLQGGSVINLSDPDSLVSWTHSGPRGASVVFAPGKGPVSACQESSHSAFAGTGGSRTAPSGDHWDRVYQVKYVVYEKGAAFVPGKDPVSAYQQEPPPSAFAATHKSRTAPSSDHWDRVRLVKYLVYDEGVLDGLAGTWRENGRKEFTGQYKAGRREGWRCWFNDDDANTPRLLLHCSENEVDAIHLVSADLTVASFKGVDEAKNDAAASLALDEIERIENELKGMRRRFQDEINERQRKSRQSLANGRNVQKRNSMLNNIHEQNKEKATEMGGFIQGHTP